MSVIIFTFFCLANSLIEGGRKELNPTIKEDLMLASLMSFSLISPMDFFIMCKFISLNFILLKIESIASSVPFESAFNIILNVAGGFSSMPIFSATAAPACSVVSEICSACAKIFSASSFFASKTAFFASSPLSKTLNISPG